MPHVSRGKVLRALLATSLACTVLVLLPSCPGHVQGPEVFPRTGENAQRPLCPRKDASAVAIGEQIYLIGGASYPDLYPWGHDGRPVYRARLPIEALDPQTMTYTDTGIVLPRTLPDPTSPDRPVSALLDLDQMVAVVHDPAAGRDVALICSGLTGRIARFDPQEPGLTLLEAAMLAHTREDGAAAVLDGRVYFLGGMKDRRPVLEVEAFDVATGRMLGPSELPLDPWPAAAGREDFAAVVLQERIFLFGGKDADYALRREVWSFDPSASPGRQWQLWPEDPLPVGMDHAGAVALDGEAYLISGVGAGAVSRDLLSFAPQRPPGQRWRRDGSLPELVFRGAVTAHEGRIFLISGFTFGKQEQRGQLQLSDMTFRIDPRAAAPARQVAGPAGSRPQPLRNPAEEQPFNFHVTLSSQSAEQGARELTVSYTPHPLDDDCTVRYRPTESPESSWLSTSATLRSYTLPSSAHPVCHVRLPALPDGTRWTVWPVTHRTTAPGETLHREVRLPGSEDGLDFVVWSDSHGRFEVLRQLEDSMLEREPLPELAFFLGDMGNLGLQEEWNGWFEAMAPLAGIPVMPALGNHEFEASTYFGQFALPQEGVPAEGRGKWYALELGPALFLVLFGNDSSTFPAQTAWAEQVLAASRAPWRFVMVHEPPLSSGRHGSDGRFSRVGPSGKSLLDVLESGGVAMIFSGHDHFYERTLPVRGARFDGARHTVKERGRGMVHVVTGGAGADQYLARPRAEVEGDRRWIGFRKPDPDRGETERANPAFHYVKVRLQGEVLHLQAIEVNMASSAGVPDDGKEGVLDEIWLRRLDGPNGGVVMMERG